MPNDDSQTPHSTRDLSNPSEEEDLWELEEDFNDVSQESPIARKEETVQPTPDTVPNTEEKAKKALKVFKPAVTKETQAPNDDASESPASPEPEQKPAETADLKQEKSETTNRLSILEKISLGLFTIALLGLGVYGYIWLYNKNVKEDDTTVKLPVQGEHITISEFSTHWTAAKNNTDAKIGSRVLPAVHLSLPAENKVSGALRFHFRNKEDNIVGDPVTISIHDGKIAQSSKSSIKVENDGASATIIASDGFKLEGDFGAYLLDPSLAWKVYVFEADSASASGHAFKEIIATRLSPKRK